MNRASKKIVCLFGPTASGKTDLAIRLVDVLPFEIISVDSAMVYRGMDIGTAKPTAREQALAPHRLIDICDPAESYSAGQFCRDAYVAIDAIFNTGKIPLLVGGTMLYFRLLQKGFHDFPGADSGVRQAIDLEAAEQGWPALHAKLVGIDPQAAACIHPNDSQRIQRALELWTVTGKTRSSLQQEQQWSMLPFEILPCIIAPSHRSTLHQRIAVRWDSMIQAGLLEEVAALYQRGDLNLTMPSMRTVGYQQCWRYLSGEYNDTALREAALAATRQFAKRQCTWLKQWPTALRFDAENSQLFDEVLTSCVRLLNP